MTSSSHRAHTRARMEAKNVGLTVFDEPGINHLDSVGPICTGRKLVRFPLALPNVPLNSFHF
jgi:hypothetical protein